MNASVILYQYRRNDQNDPASTSGFLVTNLGLSTAFERHLLRSRFSPYVGAGISYFYSYIKNSTAGSLGSSESRTDTHSATIRVTLGAEFWLSRNFSLAGQYSLGVRYSSQKHDYISSRLDPRETQTDLWRTSLGGGGGRLAVYF